MFCATVLGTGGICFLIPLRGDKAAARTHRLAHRVMECKTGAPKPQDPWVSQLGWSGMTAPCWSRERQSVSEILLQLLAMHMS